MIPTPTPPSPGAVAKAPAAAKAAGRVRLSLTHAGLLLVGGGTLLAAAIAYVLALTLGQPPWPAALAAAVALALAAVPVALLMARLLRDAAPAARTAAPAATVAGIARPLFMDLAEREWARARRYGSGAALLLVEIDRHARLCETRGTAAGEAVLAELLRRTAPTLRPADVLTRFGESRMAVLLAQADATGALDVAERIRERAEQLELPPPQPGPATAIRITVSVGVAHMRPAHLSLQALLDDADDAVGAARQAGGNCVRAAPLDASRSRGAGPWRGDDRRSKPTRPRSGGSG